MDNSIRNRLSDFLANSIYIIFSVCLIVILSLIMLCGKDNYAFRKSFLLPEILLLIGGIVPLFLGGVLASKDSQNQLNQKKQLNIATGILFIALSYLAMNIYFATGWDAGVVFDDAKELTWGNTPDNSLYYSMYPNNQFILFVDYVLCKINAYYGVIDSWDGRAFIIFVQCFLYSLTARTVYEVIYDETDNNGFAWIGWIIFCILLGISGWIVIPYTDSMGLVFPILIMRQYQLFRRIPTKKLWRTFTITLLSYWGYKLKPMILIMAIAIVITEIIYGLKDISKSVIKNRTKYFIAMLMIIAITVIASQGLFKKAIAYTRIEIDENMNLGALHMLMMGLNERRGGAWNPDDVALSSGILDKTERANAQKQVIRQRLHDYGTLGLLNHLRKKTLSNFNDGSFAWGLEGNFYHTIYDEKNERISPFLREIFYHTGKYWKYHLAIKQAAWLAVLFLMAFSVMLEKTRAKTVLVTSSIGMFLFVTLFETRARYLIVFVPVFICVATIDLNAIVNKFVQRKK
ncbi:hypothetical protein [Butyrivibrio sp. AE3009]|uniref:hypothetical protein n=1 Tax=Butyrivibrio sp. AE3009 TaxID=1280666 RepID=UPI0003B4FDC9|nr:hypothetical protein [Butyrivibrio sp. AE3009]